MIYYASLMKYGSKYKLTCLDVERGLLHVDRRISEKGSINRQKLKHNVIRARNMVYAYALSNPFSHFITLTLDSTKIDRYDLSGYIKKLGQFLYNYSRRKLPEGERIIYLLLPELHRPEKQSRNSKSGNGILRAVHLHGLIRIPSTELTPFEYGKHPAHLVKKGYLNFPEYQAKFGHCSLSPIRSVEAVASYTTKYLFKNVTDMADRVNCRLYYSSKGLSAGELVFRKFVEYSGDFDFANEFCKIRWFDHEDELYTVHEILDDIYVPEWVEISEPLPWDDEAPPEAIQIPTAEQLSLF